MLSESACTWPAQGYCGLVHVPDRVVLKLKVYGKRTGKRSRLRVDSFTATVKHGHVQVRAGHGDVRSIEQAQREALWCVEKSRALEKARQRSYDPRAVTAIYRWDERSAQWVPFASCFCFDFEPSATMPPGRYALVYPDGDVSLYVMHGSGYTAQYGDPSVRDLVSWIPRGSVTGEEVRS